jgi:hypothetical protein
MKIEFNTKEESNKKREEYFLSLSPAERVLNFFELISKIKSFPTKKFNLKSNNFIIEIKND